MTEFTLLLKEKDYSVYGLEANPFPYAGVPDEHPTIYVGQEEVIEKINSVLSSTVVSGQSNHLILTGSYGNGKSHTLKYIKSHIRENYSKKQDPLLCIGYISQPGETFLDIYTKFMYDIGYNFVKQVSEAYLGHIAYQLSKEGIIEIPIRKGKGWDKISNGEILISEVVPHAIKRLNDDVKFIDFTRAFISLTYEENSIYSWEWLCGEGVEYTKRRELSLGKNLNDVNSIRAFGAFKFILQIMGYSSIILLIDEFEYIETLPPLKKQKILNSIRHIIDVNADGLSIIIACAPEVWQAIVSEYHAFSERIGKETNLKPLDQEKIRYLILSYLNNKRAQENDTLFPFSDEAIEKIFTISQGNTRRIISLCSQALDASMNSDKGEVDTDVIDTVIS